MPPRLNKRQQRELEELEALGKASPEINLSSDDESTGIAAPSTSGGFAALFTAADDEEEPESTDEGPLKPVKARKSKKKKKKVSTVVDAENVSGPNAKRSSSPAPQTAKSQNKPPGKKGKGKEKKSDKDDLDQALAELSIKYPDLKKQISSTPTPSTSTTSANPLASLLSVSLAHLDSEAEMRKFFGSRVVSAAKSSSAGSPGTSSRGRQVGAQKSHLTRPQPSWWAAKQREGLSIRVYNQEDVEEKLVRQGWEHVEEKWWTVEYSKNYKGVTMSFMQAVMSGDPENFGRLLHKLPWHADTLLQLSEVYRHREEYSQAVDFVERALFTYERCFIGSFNFTSGVNRLDFDRVENRPFFLALHRQVTDLQRRGCVRTAFEFARLLYSLDPWIDPHGALLHLDYLAIKCGMGQWLLDLWDYFDESWQEGQHRNRVNVSVLPGWAYARALALRSREDAAKDKDHEASDNALREAIQTFPEVVPLLADKADISLSSEIRSARVFQIVTEGSFSSASHNFLHLLSHLYAQRSFPLWKDPKRASWFANTVKGVLPSAKWSQSRRDRFLQNYKVINQRYSTYRQIMILESSYRRLFAFIPREVLDAKQLACDPLPPLTTLNIYDKEFFRGADDVFASRPGTRRNAANDQRLLERLIPDPHFRQQLQAFFDANPGFVDRFPGGIVQFLQMAGELPADALEDIMIAEVMGNEGQNINMPGAMPDQEPLFAEFTDGEDEADDDADAPTDGHTRVEAQNIRNLHDIDSDKSSDDDDEEDSELEDVTPMPVRLIRNIINRFWGGAAAATTDNTSDSEEGSNVDEPLDYGGVD
ncbi:hypothetical protein PILCRDRAFT_823483 [Piloderma croceum F 1598]|uniref:DUF654-domain-containing protein n=1 Tax=Piloderma croceum (strain F 1598) TaxID=765440 RepID=A0A0C3BQH1_PILCF|nr:hypothetical protein PILCRDRAFT_823483 [Piloderma croceum F 1598]